MKTFMEEYGLIIVAILVVAALIALAVAFNTKSTKNANEAIDKFTTKSNAAIDKASNGDTSGSGSTETPKK